MSIEWQEGAVCFADSRQWFFNDSGKPYNLVSNMHGTRLESYIGVTNMPDFQLNTIKQGDYIEASELDTEQKYNDVVGVFDLFGYGRGVNYNTLGLFDFCFIAKNGHIGGCSERHLLSISHRKLTFNQLMAIGELKRLELERDKLNSPEIPDSCEDVVNNQEVKMQKNKPVVAQVMIDLTERMEIGIKTYGEALRANNGRDALQDAYEEALDLACYLKQAMIERDNADTN